MACESLLAWLVLSVSGAVAAAPIAGVSYRLGYTLSSALKPSATQTCCPAAEKAEIPTAHQHRNPRKPKILQKSFNKNRSYTVYSFTVAIQSVIQSYRLYIII